MKDTFFATAERASEEKIKSEFDDLHAVDYLKTVINALPEVVAILNEERQIIFGNDALLKFLGIVDEKELLGLRPGEAIKCINSGLIDGGCGTSKKCRYCGAISAILESQHSMKKVTKECRITTKNDDKFDFLDLRITSTPFKFQNNHYSILSIDDITDIKRRNLLERVFFHDVINIAGGLKGVTEFLIDAPNKFRTKETFNLINKMSKELLEEIMSQRALTFAESGELHLEFKKISTISVLKETVSYLLHHSISKSKNILIYKDAIDTKISTDAVLLKRVLINMLKNALEASDDGADVIMNCKSDGNFIIFTVRNHRFMPLEVQKQIFQRSFSTKSESRGLGTYSIKLLTESYLNGTTGFNSTPENGTEFFVRIPKK